MKGCSTLKPIVSHITAVKNPPEQPAAEYHPDRVQYYSRETVADLVAAHSDDVFQIYHRVPVSKRSPSASVQYPIGHANGAVW
jgi:hypothetical protein